MREVLCSELTLDFAIHPRGEIDAEHAERIATAIRSGEAMPPIVVCEKSRRVVDGFHRFTAYVMANGNRCLIPIVEKRYRSDAELFMDAIRYNATHGARIGVGDYAKCMEIALRLEVDLSSVAGLLHVPVGRLGELRVIGNGNQIRISLDRSTSVDRRSDAVHPTGHSIKQDGRGVILNARKLIRAIDSGSIDFEKDGVWDVMELLHRKLKELIRSGVR